MRIIPAFGELVHDTIDIHYRELVATGQMASSTWELSLMIYRTQIEDHPIADIPIDKLTPGDFEGWSRELVTQPRYKQKNGRKVLSKPARAMNANTKFRYMGMVHGILQRKVDDKTISSNPAPRAGEKADVEFRILDGGEIERLLTLADLQDLDIDYFAPVRHKGKLMGRMRLVVLIGLHGIGPAEQCGLEPKHWNGERLRVVQQAQRGKLLPTLKTKNRRRDVYVTDPDLVELLNNATGPYILPTINGEPFCTNNLRRSFASMVKGTEFEGMHPYDLRHTCAMTLLEAGVDVRTVAEILGNTPEVVLNNYCKSRPELKRKAADAIRPLRMA